MGGSVEFTGITTPTPALSECMDTGLRRYDNEGSEALTLGLWALDAHHNLNDGPGTKSSLHYETLYI
jgi:hypothetical protein